MMLVVRFVFTFAQAILNGSASIVYFVQQFFFFEKHYRSEKRRFIHGIKSILQIRQ